MLTSSKLSAWSSFRYYISLLRVRLMMMIPLSVIHLATAAAANEAQMHRQREADEEFYKKSLIANNFSVSSCPLAPSYSRLVVRAMLRSSLYFALIFALIVHSLFSHCSLLPAPLSALSSALSLHSLFFVFAPGVSEHLSRNSTQAWMDDREFELVVRTIKDVYADKKEKKKEKKNQTDDEQLGIEGINVLEYGSGLSTLSLSSLPEVSRYVSIEHSASYCYQLASTLSSSSSRRGARITLVERVHPYERNMLIAADEAESKVMKRTVIYDTIIEKKQKQMQEEREGEGGVEEELQEEDLYPKGLYVYCVKPDAPSPEESSLLTSCACCFSRCPSQTSTYSTYITYPLYAFGVETETINPSSSSSSSSSLMSSSSSSSSLSPSSSFSFASVSAFLPFSFDVILIDGRARPQCAVAALTTTTTIRTSTITTNTNKNKLTMGNGKSVSKNGGGKVGEKRRRVLAPAGKVLLHDWNRRSAYRAVLLWFSVVSSQFSSAQPGGGGLVVLEPKTPAPNIDETKLPEWW